MRIIFHKLTVAIAALLTAFSAASCAGQRTAASLDTLPKSQDVLQSISDAYNSHDFVTIRKTETVADKPCTSITEYQIDRQRMLTRVELTYQSTVNGTVVNVSELTQYQADTGIGTKTIYIADDTDSFVISQFEAAAESTMFEYGDIASALRKHLADGTYACDVAQSDERTILVRGKADSVPFIEGPSVKADETWVVELSADSETCMPIKCIYSNNSGRIITFEYLSYENTKDIEVPGLEPDTEGEPHAETPD